MKKPYEIDARAVKHAKDFPYSPATFQTVWSDWRSSHGRRANLL